MKNLTYSNQSATRRRRGSALYITVVGVALIVSLMGALAMVTARLELRRVGQSQDIQHARGLSQSALEFGLANIEFDANWRTTFANDVESSPLDWQGISSEVGTMTFKIVDESDGDLADDPSDMARLYGIGRVGEAQYVTSVLLEPTGPGLSCLEGSLHSDGNIWMWNGVTIATNQFASTNGSMYRSGSGLVSGDGEAVGSIQSGSISGTATTGITPRQMPDSTLAFQYYLNNGTWIDIDDVPGTVPNLIEQVVLSPGNNPYGDGETNPQGIYLIDCEGEALRIKLVRLVGTLVILNPGAGSDLDNDQHWEPAVPNFPVLMVRGNIKFNWHGEHELSESMAGINYNPTHTPYNDESDADLTDSYPGVIKGLIYVSGSLDIQHECVMDGVVVSGGINPQANMTLTYDPTFLNYPPPGFHRNVGPTTGPTELRSYFASSSLSEDDIKSNKWWAQYFKPNLPVDAVNWSVSSVDIWVTREGSDSGNLDVGLYTPSGSNMPIVRIDEVPVDPATLPWTYGWTNVPFSGYSGLDPNEGLVLTLTTGESDPPARLRYKSAGVSESDSALITGGPTWATYETDKALLYKIHGTYQTSNGSVVQISPGSWRREPGI